MYVYVYIYTTDCLLPLLSYKPLTWITAPVWATSILLMSIVACDKQTDAGNLVFHYGNHSFCLEIPHKKP